MALVLGSESLDVTTRENGWLAFWLILQELFRADRVGMLGLGERMVRCGVRQKIPWLHTTNTRRKGSMLRDQLQWVDWHTKENQLP